MASTPKSIIVIGALGALFSGLEVNPSWWGLYNWARESDTYRPRLGEVSRGIRDNNDVPVITKDLVNGLFLSKGYMSGSVTRLERYQQCPVQVLCSIWFKTRTASGALLWCS